MSCVSQRCGSSQRGGHYEGEVVQVPECECTSNSTHEKTGNHGDAEPHTPQVHGQPAQVVPDENAKISEHA
jgi:hypothetical protein